MVYFLGSTLKGKQVSGYRTQVNIVLFTSQILWSNVVHKHYKYGRRFQIPPNFVEAPKIPQASRFGEFLGARRIFVERQKSVETVRSMNFDGVNSCGGFLPIFTRDILQRQKEGCYSFN